LYSFVNYLLPAYEETPQEEKSKPISRILPWEDPTPIWRGRERELKLLILRISANQDLFRIDVPDNVEGFTFDLENARDYEVATQMLQIDTNLSNMRFYLVPRLISEDSFWRAYFYIIHIILHTESISGLDIVLEQMAEGSKHKRREYIRELEKDFKLVIKTIEECMELIRKFIKETLDKQEHKDDDYYEVERTLHSTDVEKKFRECIELKKRISMAMNELPDTGDFETKINNLGTRFAILITEYDKFKQLVQDGSGAVLKVITFRAKLLGTTREPPSVTSPTQRQKICASVLPSRFRVQNWKVSFPAQFLTL
jgi:hypothetical protein